MKRFAHVGQTYFIGVKQENQMTVRTPRKDEKTASLPEAKSSTPDAQIKQGPSQTERPCPRMSPRPSRLPLAIAEKGGAVAGIARADSFIPVLKHRNKPSGHSRQHSAPDVYRKDQTIPRSPRERKRTWLKAFNALAGLREGKIEVRIDCVDQFNTFLDWARGRPVHALTLADGRSGLERDLAALQHAEATEEVRQHYKASPGITDILEALPGLQFLDISRCDPSEPDLLKFLTRLKSDACRLTSLKADWLYWGGEEVVESLLSLLAGPTRLSSLAMASVRACKLTPHLLLTALRTNTGLQDVSFSVSGERGAVDPEDIALAIFMNSTLKKLSISTKRFISVAGPSANRKPADFKVNDLVIYHFMSAFVKNTTLEELGIQGTPLPATIIDAITESLGDKSAIRSMDLVASDENKEALRRLQVVLEEREMHRDGASARV